MPSPKAGWVEGIGEEEEAKVVTKAYETTDGVCIATPTLD
jgi:hypothetical protein